MLTYKESADVTSDGNSFLTLALATGNERSPIENSPYRDTDRLCDAAERRPERPVFMVNIVK